MTPVTNVLMVGVGGQGIVLSSDILAEAALRSGLDVKKSEVHGMSQRGGAVFSHVRFGPRVFSPMIPKGEADVIFSLETMEVLRWATHARPKAAAVYLDERILPSGEETYPEGVTDEIDRLFNRVIAIMPNELKTRVEHKKTHNVALLGALSTALELSADAYADAIERLAPKGTAPLNQRAFEIGRGLAQND